MKNDRLARILLKEEHKDEEVLDEFISGYLPESKSLCKLASESMDIKVNELYLHFIDKAYSRIEKLEGAIVELCNVVVWNQKQLLEIVAPNMIEHCENKEGERNE